MSHFQKLLIFRCLCHRCATDIAYVDVEQFMFPFVTDKPLHPLWLLQTIPNVSMTKTKTLTRLLTVYLYYSITQFNSHINDKVIGY